jgi:uncharacterized protein (TIGR02246 family)
MSLFTRTRALAAVAVSVLALAVGVAAGPGSAAVADTHANTPGKPCQQSKDTILDLPHQIFAAWNAQDPAGIAAVFGPDANFIPTNGARLEGPAGIKTYYTAAFAGPLKGTRMIGTPSSFRCLAPNVAVIDGLGGILLPGETYTSPTQVPIGRRLIVSWTATHYGAQQGWKVPVWKIAEFQATTIAG